MFWVLNIFSGHLRVKLGSKVFAFFSQFWLDLAKISNISQTKIYFGFSKIYHGLARILKKIAWVGSAKKASGRVLTKPIPITSTTSLLRPHFVVFSEVFNYRSLSTTTIFLEIFLLFLSPASDQSTEI